MIHSDNHFKPAPVAGVVEEPQRKKGLFGLFG
jgi:hypothetical protein